MNSYGAGYIGTLGVLVLMVGLWFGGPIAFALAWGLGSAAIAGGAVYFNLRVVQRGLKRRVNSTTVTVAVVAMGTMALVWPWFLWVPILGLHSLSVWRIAERE